MEGKLIKEGINKKGEIYMRISKYIIFILSMILCFGCVIDDDDDKLVYKVAVLGDSISEGCNPDLSTYGEMYAEKYGWVDMMKENDINNYIDLQNYAITGSKASEWNINSSDNTTWHVWDDEMGKILDYSPDICIVYIGANDIMEYMADGQISEAEWNALRFDIEGIVDTIKASKEVITILLVGYYDLFDGMSQYLTGTEYAYYADLSLTTTLGNQMLEEIANEKNITYISVYDEFLHHGYGKLLGDPLYESPSYFTDTLTTFDIHPVTEGHRAIYNIIKDKLETLVY